MRHGTALRQLSRDRAHRASLFKNLTTSLVLHDRITTTVAKAKEVRRFADKLITQGKRNRLGGVQSMLFDNAAVQKVMTQLVPRFASRPGGYTRLVLIGPRLGDHADMALLEYVGGPDELTPERRWAPKPVAETAVAQPVTATQPLAEKVPRPPMPLVVGLPKPTSMAASLKLKLKRTLKAAPSLPRPSPPLLAPPKRRTWDCPNCQHECSLARIKCPRCKAPRDG